MMIDDQALYYMRQLIKANISAASDILAWLIKSNFNVNHRKPCCGLHLSHNCKTSQFLFMQLICHKVFH